MPTARIAIDRGSDIWNGRSALQSYAMQCESRENGPIVHNGIEKENEKLSVCNIPPRPIRFRAAVPECWHLR